MTAQQVSQSAGMTHNFPLVPLCLELGQGLLYRLARRYLKVGLVSIPLVIVVKIKFPANRGCLG